MRLILQLCLCVLVLLGARTSSWGRMVCHETATTSQAFIRVSETDPDAPPMGVSSGDWLSNDASGFEDGPNLYAYVKQNPWTAFDPDGLATKSQLHKQKRELTKRRDTEKAAREKNGETQTVLGINAQGDATIERTEFGEVMNTFNTAIDRLQSRITEIDRAVDVHNGALDAMGALTGGKHSSHRLSRVQFDDEDPKNQVFLRNGNRAIDFRNDVALALLTAGTGKLISVGGKAMKLLSPASVKGFRAVSNAELDDIAKYGFRPHPEGRSMQDKWFSESRGGAESFQKTYPELEHVIEAKVPKSVYDTSFKHPNIDQTGPGFAVPAEQLPKVTPKLP